MTKIKICGITTLTDARCVAQAGADMLGFIFYPKSARYVSPSRAGEITQAIRGEFGPGAPQIIGVFVDESSTTIRAVSTSVCLDAVQLHGTEGPEVIQQLGSHAFKAISPQTLAEAETMLTTYRSTFDTRQENLPDLLVDAYAPIQRGGTGRLADMAIAHRLTDYCRLLLAGGLQTSNVADVIRRVHPWGVDVSSGVELRKGIKDHNLISTFVDAVRSADSK